MLILNNMANLHSLPLYEPGTQRKINIYNKKSCHLSHLNSRKYIADLKYSLFINFKTIPSLFSFYISYNKHLNLDANILNLNNN